MILMKKKNILDGNEINSFLQNVFPNDENERIDLNTFYNRIKPNYSNFIQKFLQMVICLRLEITLKPDDFSDPNKVISPWEEITGDLLR